MKEDNILPYDGKAVLIDDSGSDFDWPAVTRTFIETMPWQVEMARMFGREMPVPRIVHFECPKWIRICPANQTSHWDVCSRSKQS